LTASYAYDRSVSTDDDAGRQAWAQQRQVDAEVRESEAGLDCEELRGNRHAMTVQSKLAEAAGRRADERTTRLDRRQQRLDARETGADRRDADLGERERQADERDRLADQREIDEAQST
jgi:hypothetical protein